jgi:hypothetical protein
VSASRADEKPKETGSQTDEKSKEANEGKEAPSVPASGDPNRPPDYSPPGVLSSWITYHRPDCCGPLGGNGPIFSELYVRTGPSFTVGGGVFRDLLDTGWEVMGGGRSLFFNPPQTAAWTVDFSLSHTYSHAEGLPKVPLEITVQPPANPITGILPPTHNQIIPVTVRNFQRTFVNASLGREWYLNGTACSGGCRWRVGLDAGGRLGTGKSDIFKDPSLVFGNEVSPKGHLTDTLYGPFGALHTDWEVPCCGCCTFLGGVRVEGDYISSDMLKGLNNSNLVDVNLLISLGVRF